MPGPSIVFSCALPPHMAEWRSLVTRSIAAWDNIVLDEDPRLRHHPIMFLQEWKSLDDFLNKAGDPYMLWFFQRLSAFMSQTRLKKWSRDNLGDYILMPGTLGFVTRRDCFFISHFWLRPDDPDPDGDYLRRHQAELSSQAWSYIWLDWSCMPQSPRSPAEDLYFRRCLPTMPSIIRNCAFQWFYPPFEPRLWILFEIAEFSLTSTGEIPRTPDIQTYLQHVSEMLRDGVQTTLKNHGYRCSYDRDRLYLTSWLELLVLLRRSKMDLVDIRHIMDAVTWFRHTETLYFPAVTINKYEGTLSIEGTTHEFSPFPKEVIAGPISECCIC